MATKWRVRVYDIIEGTDKWPVNEERTKDFATHAEAEEYADDLTNQDDCHTPGPVEIQDWQ